MTENTNPKRYDLEDRTLMYAKDIIEFVGMVPNTVANTEIIKQLIRSASSVGANYIEANGFLGKKDFAMRIRICRKEAKESRFWLHLITVNKEALENQRQALIKETEELLRIFGAILEKIKLQ
jgi:four helix bundle protein